MALDGADPGGGVPARVEEVYADLGPVERRVADFVLDHLGELPGFTGAELATASGTSKATVSRFFRRLGFASFAAARADARTRGLPVGQLPAGDDPVAVHLAHDLRNLERVGATLTAETVDSVARLLASARRVVVVGWRNSYPVAVHLREQLLQARPGVALAPHPGQTVAEEVADLDHRDALVVAAFRRRPPAVATLLGAGLEVPTVLVADPTARTFAPRVTHRVEVPVDGPGAFDSYAAAMAVTAVLAEAVLARRGRAGRDRVAQVARAHGRLAELEP